MSVHGLPIPPRDQVDAADMEAALALADVLAERLECRLMKVRDLLVECRTLVKGLHDDEGAKA